MRNGMLAIGPDVSIGASIQAISANTRESIKSHKLYTTLLKTQIKFKCFVLTETLIKYVFNSVSHKRLLLYC